MKDRIYRKVLNFVKHVHMQNEDSLAKQVLEEQLENKWPGLAEEAIKAADILQLDGLMNQVINKNLFKRKVKSARQKANDNYFDEEILKFKKLRTLQDEVTKGNEYFFNESIENARVIYRFRTQMYEAKLNFKNKKEYKDEQYLCDSCEREVDQNSHVLFCPSYQELRDGKNLQNDQDLAYYLQKVLAVRSKLRLSR